MRPYVAREESAHDQRYTVARNQTSEPPDAKHHKRLTTLCKFRILTQSTSPPRNLWSFDQTSRKKLPTALSEISKKSIKPTLSLSISLFDVQTFSQKSTYTNVWLKRFRNSKQSAMAAASYSKLVLLQKPV